MRRSVNLSLATDVGGGTSFSMLQTMNEAYKVARLKGSYLPAARMFYLATLGAARSMQLEGTIGSFAPGAEADFIVLDPACTPLLARRTERCANLEELLFVLALLGDDRAVGDLRRRAQGTRAPACIIFGSSTYREKNNAHQIEQHGDRPGVRRRARACPTPAHQRARPTRPSTARHYASLIKGDSPRWRS